ncbi:MAG: hypothetical protein EOO16_07210 [Chitinophagaceae bacterium]|nr:MAG: hypothetical protein EOO16_07210 [Chitinophagaceae bacterium]
MGLPFQVYMLLVCALIGVFRWPQLDKPVRILVALLLVGLLNELATPLHLIPGEKRNAYRMSIYVLIETAILAWLFSLVLLRQGHRRWVLVLAGICAVSWLVEAMWLKRIGLFVSNTYCICLLSYVAWTLLYFKEVLLEEEEREGLVSRPMFWISTGLLFFSLGMFVYVAALVYVGFRPEARYTALWDNLTNVINSVFYLCLIVGFVSARRRPAYA